MKTENENPKGLHAKYVIKKIIGWKRKGFWGNDEPVTKDVAPEFEGFILRLDKHQNDHNHFRACRIAVNAYADSIELHIPQLAADIRMKWPTPESETLKYGDPVKCSMDSDYNGFWLGTYIGKHPAMDAHIVLTRTRPELRISEELDAYAYCKFYNWKA